MYNGTSWNTIAGGYSNDLAALQLMGATIKTTPVGVQTIPSTAASMVSSRSFFNAIYLSKESTITGATWYQSAQGVYIGTGGNYNGIALYRDSSGTLLLIDSTTRDTTIWKATSGSWNQKAFAGGTRTLQPGVYYLLALSNTATGTYTTAPGLGAWQAISFSGLLTNSRRLFGGITSGVTIPPTSQAMSSWNSFPFYFSLYLY
jgi:hypothetical protein